MMGTRTTRPSLSLLRRMGGSRGVAFMGPTAPKGSGGPNAHKGSGGPGVWRGADSLRGSARASPSSAKALHHGHDRPSLRGERVGYVVHELPHEEDPPAVGLEQVLRGQGVGNGVGVEAGPLVVD